MTFEAEQLGESGPELASLLRNLRKRAGLSGDRLAARCNMSQSKVSRIENGKTRPSLVDVEQILRALEAPPELVAEVSALARLANTEWRNLRELRRKGLGTRQTELKALEASSTHMRYFLLSMVTGLGLPSRTRALPSQVLGVPLGVRRECGPPLGVGLAGRDLFPPVRGRRESHQFRAPVGQQDSRVTMWITQREIRSSFHAHAMSPSPTREAFHAICP